jgi:hypothetical protein
MSITPKFCPLCGGQLTPTARFCGDCGHRIEVPVPAAPAPPPPSHSYAQPVAMQPPASPAAAGEAVMGILPILQRRKGLFGAESFAVVLTNHRLIFAMVTSQMLQDAAAEAKQQARQQGKGFLSQWGAVMSSGFRFAQRYLQMQPNAILAEHGENFYFLHDQVQQVRLKDSDPDEPNDREQVEFHTTGGKHRFIITYGSLKDIREALKPLYGKRIR